MAKIRILVDAHVFDGKYQGTTTYIKGLYNALVQHEDIEITLAAKNIENLKNHFQDSRFNFIALNSKSSTIRLLLEFPELIKKNKYDFAHFQYIVPPFQKNCKYITTIHDLLFLDFPRYFPFNYRLKNKLLFHYSALNSDIVCTVSRYSLDALVKHFKLKAESIVLTPNAVEKSFLENQNVTAINIKEKYSLRKFLLYVSRIEPRKNHELLLKAYLDLQLYENFDLVLIGKNDLFYKEYTDLFKTLPPAVGNSIKHLENITPYELKEFYKAAELFIYPSFAEGFGIPPLEAALLGCKVICSNESAMKDFTFFGESLFSPHNIEELKTKILNCLKDQDYPFEKIKKEITEKYDWKSAANNLSNKLKTF
jgi:glycosyltransferase involved in cell wall biosynthesis